jgi:glycosyltransferase involved in cell wall biosynthesis
LFGAGVLEHTGAEAHPLARPRLALLVNTLAPYRLPIYRILAERFEFAVFHGGSESNRTTWRKLEEQVPQATVKQSRGRQFRYARRRDGRKIDDAYLHLNFGYFADLVRWSPEAVISNEMGLRTMLALAFGGLWRRPVWVWWGGTLHTERSIGLVRRLVRLVMPRVVRHWISYGESSTQYLQSIGVSRERILQIQNSVDEQMFATAVRPMDVAGPHPVILHVGQFIARKGIDSLLRSAARLQSRGYHFTLLLVGDGVEKSELQALSNELKLENVIFETGKRPKDMPSVYRAADYLVFPTLEDVWGLVANEALLSGVPVLCSRYAGCAQEIIPKENIFDPLDEADFDRILISALEWRMAPADSRTLHTSRQNAERIIAEVMSILGKKRKGNSALVLNL